MYTQPFSVHPSYFASSGQLCNTKKKAWQTWFLNRYVMIDHRIWSIFGSSFLKESLLNRHHFPIYIYATQVTVNAHEPIANSKFEFQCRALTVNMTRDLFSTKMFHIKANVSPWWYSHGVLHYCGKRGDVKKITAPSYTYTYTELCMNLDVIETVFCLSGCW